MENSNQTTGTLAKLKRFFGPQDMTKGDIWYNIIAFSVPLLIGNFVQQLYSTVDSIIVGNFAANGDGALSAVGVSGPVINLMLVLLMGIATGAGIMVSQYFGARQEENLSDTVGTCLLLTVLSTLIISILGIFLAGPILTLLKTPADVFDMAKEYLQIIFAGLIGSALYNIVSGVLRGLGDSFFPLIFLIVASLINIVLDFIFVYYYHWDVGGVALATVIAQAVAAALCLLRLFRMKNVIRLKKHNFRFNKHMAIRLTKLGLPAGITQGIFSIAMLVVQALTNSMGTDVMAMSTVVMRVDGFAMMPNFTFGMAATTFVGQNLGSRKMDRIEDGSKKIMLMALGIATLLTLCLLLFGGSLMRGFTKNATIVELGIRAMRIIAVGYICFAINQVLSGILRGAGQTMVPMIVALITTIALRVPIAYILAHFTRSELWPNGSPDALYISLLVSWSMGAVLTFFYYKFGNWKKKAAQDMFKEETFEANNSTFE